MSKMINVVFDESVSGSLHITNEPGADRRIKDRDILCLAWMLDIGFLKDGIESEYRKELPGKLIMQGCYGKECEEGIPEIGEKNLKNWQTLIKHLEKKRAIRIWYSDAPHSLCGFYHVCSLLQNYEADVFVIHAPKVAKDKTDWYLAHSWGNHPQHDIGQYIGLQRMLDKREIKLYAEHWNELVSENYPLRAVISGIPTSVNEDFYDSFIERDIPSEPIKEAVVIMNTIDNYHFGISSAWLEYRIQHSIEQGRIKIIKDNEEATRRIIQRCCKN